MALHVVTPVQDISQLLPFHWVVVNYIFQIFLRNFVGSAFKLLCFEPIMRVASHPVRICTATKTLQVSLPSGQYINAYIKQMDKLCINATFIHFVFDSHLDGSVKDSERMRRSKTLAVELTNIDPETLLPLDFESFRGSNENKKKLQLLLCQWSAI